MTDPALARKAPALDPRKFRDPDVTADGEPRGVVPFFSLKTLWVNTGTLCNLTCEHCYIESSPTNDRLVYLTASEVARYLDEIEVQQLPTEEIGFTGGEPFMNPDIMETLEDSLARGFRVLVLTNAMRPMLRHKGGLSELKKVFGPKLVIRVSLDHYGKALHESKRGKDTYEKTVKGLAWLSQAGFAVRVVGRTCWGEPVDGMREGYRRLFHAQDISIDAENEETLVFFPEMDATADVPEITQGCWKTLGVEPSHIMCATSRMVVKRKGADGPVVLACTLVAYDPEFEMGKTLAEAARPVKLNHPHCARFCVLGGGVCSKVA